MLGVPLRSGTVSVLLEVTVAAVSWCRDRKLGAVTLQEVEAPESLDQIAIIEGTDKRSVDHDCARPYEGAFAEFGDEPIQPLEFGVAKGASLQM